MKHDLYVKFNGKFKDLIPDGWKFQKLFARNYRCYHKTDIDLNIWQHLGGYLEIADLFNDSAVIVQKLIQGKRNELTTFKSKMVVDSSKKLGFSQTEKEEVCWLQHDVEQHEFIPYHDDRRKNIMLAKWSQDPEVYKPAFDRYREVNLNIKTLDCLEQLIEKGWIEVIEDKRKRNQ